MSTELSSQLQAVPPIDWQQVRRTLFSRPALACVVAVLAFFVHLPAVRNGFVEWDDPEYVSQNRFIKNTSLQGLVQIWKLPAYMGLYHPVTLTTFWGIYALAKQTAAAYHLVSILLHTAASVMVFLIVAQVSRWRFAGLVAGALFAVHPVQVEVVAWVSELKTLISTAFMLLAMYLYLKADEEVRPMELGAFYAASVIAYLVAVFAKPSALMLPALLALYHGCFWWRLKMSADGTPATRPSWSRVAAMLVPFVLLSVIIAVFTIRAHGLGLERAPRAGGGLVQWALVASSSLVNYLQLWALPRSLSTLYTLPFSEITSSGFRLLCFLACAALVALVVHQRRRAPDVAFWTGWVLLNFLPVSGIVPFPTLVQDRYLYVMGPGAAALCGVGLVTLSERRRALRPAAVAVGSIVVILLSAQGVARTVTWKDTPTLWKDTVAKIVGRSIPGEHLLASGQSQVPLDLTTLTLRTYALTNFSKARNNLANAYWRMKLYEKAREQAERSLRVWPADIKALDLLATYWEEHEQLALAESLAMRSAELSQMMNPTPLTTLGRIYGRGGENEKAEHFFLQALQLCEAQPDQSMLFKIYRNLGVLYGKKRDFVRALENFRLAVQTNPDDAESRFGLGVAYFDNGDTESALREWARTVQIDPQHIRAWERLADIGSRFPQYYGVAFEAYQRLTELEPRNWRWWLGYAHLAGSMNRLTPALAAAEQAVALAPNNADVLTVLARLHTLAGRAAHAETILQRAMVLAPDSPAVFEVLGHAQLAQGDTKQAIGSFERAAELSQNPQYQEMIRDIVEQLRSQTSSASDSDDGPDDEAVYPSPGIGPPPGAH